MVKKRIRLPSMQALIAFEQAAYHSNFTKAAEQLNTSQSAISRYIRNLEEMLETRLFKRQHPKLILTESGKQLYQGVVENLDACEEMIQTIKRNNEHHHFTLVCSHEISHLYIMPRFENLQQQLSQKIQIHILTMEYDQQDNLEQDEIDLILNYQNSHETEQQHLLLQESVTPLCAPAFYEQHRETLKRFSKEWTKLPLLTLSKRNDGWMRWRDYFAHHNMVIPESPATYGFEHYAYLLEAASLGKGIALGWRGLIERYLESGMLVAPLDDYWVQSDHGLYAQYFSHKKDKKAALITKALHALRYQ